MSSLPQATGQCPPKEGESGQGLELWEGGHLTSERRNSLWKKSWETSLSSSRPASLMVLPAAPRPQRLSFFPVLFSKQHCLHAGPGNKLR